MDTESSPKQMDIDIYIIKDDNKPSRKRKLYELIRSMNGSRKRKCTEHIIPNP
uniref:Uncharacterized protein n=1 Tax=viral metagenome TaxID=1070528 RepID=A0A6C0CUR4_9ZZZZ